MVPALAGAGVALVTLAELAALVDAGKAGGGTAATGAGASLSPLCAALVAPEAAGASAGGALAGMACVGALAASVCAAALAGELDEPPELGGSEGGGMTGAAFATDAAELPPLLELDRPSAEAFCTPPPAPAPAAARPPVPAPGPLPPFAASKIDLPLTDMAPSATAPAAMPATVPAASPAVRVGEPFSIEAASAGILVDR